MNTLLVIVLVAAMVMVVISLVRGVVAFLQSTKTDLERGPDAGPSEAQLMQNKMMFARIKWQAIAIVVLAIIMAAAG